MLSTISQIFMLIFPLMVAGILHMLVVKWNVAPFLARPIHERGLGRNKTWRGLIVMPFFGVLGVLLTQYLFRSSPYFSMISEHAVLLGALLGLAYALFELPNSYLKRRMGIPPGQLADKNRGLFFILDHFDSTLGCILVYALLTPAQPWQLLLALILAPLIHVAVNFSLWVFGIRKEKF